MAKYLTKYETVAAYEADTQKDYPNVSYIAATDEVVWQKEKDYSKDYLTFVALEDGTFNFNKQLNYSVDDGQTWTALAANTDSPTVTAGNKILWKATGLTTSWNGGMGEFKSSGQFEAEGNIMSLLSGDSFSQATTVNARQFMYMFRNLSGLTSAENLILPATTLGTNCYNSMFNGCTSLTTAPELPATTLAQGCYGSMFYGCTSLTTAPELPATTLATNCYSNMFTNCTSLTTAPELPATTLAQGCYNTMFTNCTSLTTAPELPATTLAILCYERMFYNCGSLNSITCLATDISATNSTNLWLAYVPATGTFTKASSMTGWTTGDSGIPTGWTVQDFQ